MNLFFRLYYPADLDLLLMKRNMGKRFPQFVKNCLKNALDGGQSEYDPASVPVMGIPKSLSSCCVNIPLNEENDAVLISFLQSFPQNARSTVVKKILTGCAAYFPADVYETYAGMEHVCKSRPSSSSREKPSLKGDLSFGEEEKPAEHASRRKNDMNDALEQDRKLEMDQSIGNESAPLNQKPMAENPHGKKTDLDKGLKISENADDEKQAEQAPAIQSAEDAADASATDPEELDSDDDMMKLLSGMVNHR